MSPGQLSLKNQMQLARDQHKQMETFYAPLRQQEVFVRVCSQSRPMGAGLHLGLIEGLGKQYVRVLLVG